MKIGQILLEALESLSANKIRSALTMLGVIIGVASVVAMMSIGNGTQASITSQIEKIGTNLLYVSAGGDVDDPRPITTDDANAASAAVSSVSYVAPILQGNVSVSVPGSTTNASIIGLTPEYFKVQTVEIAEGTEITQAQVNKYASVAIIGYSIAEDLFDQTTGLVGKSIRVNGQIFKVIAVLEEAGGTGFGSSDNRIMVPLTTAQLRLLPREHPDEVDMLYVQAASTGQIDAAIEDVTQILRSRHRTLGEDDFDIMSTQSMLETASEITGTMTMFLGGIGGISLVVGGIGIMNIMLVTVTERTREIGLRKAIGARKNDIRIQFLIESSLLSLGGGLLGVAFGWGVAVLVGRIAAASGNTLNPVVTLSSILIATMFSAAVGLFFGMYPANRAASLEPVEALRSE